MREHGLHQLGLRCLQRFRDAPSLQKLIDLDKFGHADAALAVAVIGSRRNRRVAYIET